MNINTVKDVKLAKLFSKDRIEETIRNVAIQINNDIPPDQPLIVLPVILGGMAYCQSLLQYLHMPIYLSYIHVTRYQGTQGSENLRDIYWPEIDLSNQHVLIVDDIYDAGNTLRYITEKCKNLGCAKILTTVLLQRLPKSGNANYVGLTYEGPEYLVGYGMDYHGFLREQSDISIITD